MDWNEATSEVIEKHDDDDENSAILSSATWKLQH